jgi:hypothetical protein
MEYKPLPPIIPMDAIDDAFVGAVATFFFLNAAI